MTAAATTCPTAAAPVAVTDYAYDSLDRLMRVTEALPAAQGGNRVTETVYNADDSVHQVKRAVGTALAQTYATTTYSANGLPVTLTDAKGNRTTYEYDGHDRRVKLRYPHPTTVGSSSTTDYEQYGYNAVGSLTSHRKRSGETVTFAYDNLSRRTTVTLGNGTTTSYGYSPQGALASLSHNLAGTAQDQTLTYTRNPVQEIVSQSWTNDLYQWTGYANGTQSYTANGLNQYTTAAGATLTHDARGNLTGDGVWTYTFDADNKLKSATKTGYAATLAYDAESRLRRTTLAGAITDLAYDGVDLVAEYDGAGTLLRRYVHGPGVDEPLVWYEGSTTTAKSWLYADHLGSMIGTANSAGTSTAIHSYGPFGEPNVTTGVRFRYTGQQYLGGLNLYYYKARFYSPALGRFLQTDPIGTADDLNLYAYVGNNPVNRFDPLGLSSWEAGALSGGVGGLGGGQSPFATDWSKGTKIAAGPLLPLLGLGLMATEVATGDVPILGGSAAKGAGVVANSVRGRASETRILNELGLTKNTAVVSTAEGRSIPDALTKSLSVEVKDAASVSLTRQLRIQTDAARAAGRDSVLITGERTCVSGRCGEAFDQVIRRPDLGPR